MLIFLTFTNFGRVYWVKVHELPEGSTSSRGRPIVNLVQLEEGEQVVPFCRSASFPKKKESNMW